MQVVSMRVSVVLRPYVLLALVSLSLPCLLVISFRHSPERFTSLIASKPFWLS